MTTINGDQGGPVTAGAGSSASQADTGSPAQAPLFGLVVLLGFMAASVLSMAALALGVYRMQQGWHTTPDPTAFYLSSPPGFDSAYYGIIAVICFGLAAFTYRRDSLGVAAVWTVLGSVAILVNLAVGDLLLYSICMLYGVSLGDTSMVPTAICDPHAKDAILTFVEPLFQTLPWIVTIFGVFTACVLLMMRSLLDEPPVLRRHKAG